jgi:hypothetical protein
MSWDEAWMGWGSMSNTMLKSGDNCKEEKRFRRHAVPVEIRWWRKQTRKVVDEENGRYFDIFIVRFVSCNISGKGRMS